MIHRYRRPADDINRLRLLIGVQGINTLLKEESCCAHKDVYSVVCLGDSLWTCKISRHQTVCDDNVTSENTLIWSRTMQHWGMFNHAKQDHGMYSNIHHVLTKQRSGSYGETPHRIFGYQRDW